VFVRELMSQTWMYLQEASPWILLGFTIAGLIHAFIPQEVFAKHLQRRGFRSVLEASIMGLPLPLCSCGVIPAAVGLRKRGASKGATLSFLISTPQTGVDSWAITYAFLGGVMFVVRLVASFLTALITGSFGDWLCPEDGKGLGGQENACPHCDEEGEHRHTFPDKLKTALRFSFVELMEDTGKWIILGVLAAGVIGAIVPEGFFERYLGAPFLSMLVMLIVGIPLYICASASTPVAAALILKGMSPGAALVLLLAGPATNTSTMLVVGKFLGRRALVIYLLLIAICALGFGSLTNWLCSTFGICPTVTMKERTPGELFLHVASALFFLAAVATVYIRKLFGRKPCPHCADGDHAGHMHT